jgi:hypothetical protein
MIMFGWLGLPALAVTVPIAYLLTRQRHVGDLKEAGDFFFCSTCAR